MIPTIYGLVSRTVLLKYHLAINFSHSLNWCETTNTWSDPHCLPPSMRFQFLVKIGITMGNKPKKRISLTITLLWSYCNAQTTLQFGKHTYCKVVSEIDLGCQKGRFWLTQRFEKCMRGRQFQHFWVC